MRLLVHIFQNNKQEGPYTTEEIQQMLESGSIAPITLAWADGMPDWAPLSTVLALAPPPTPAAAPAPTQTLTASEPFYTPTPAQPMPVPLGPTGVGGWLLLFCVGLTVLGPLFFINQTTEAWKGAEAAFSHFPSLKTGVIVENTGLALIQVCSVVVGLILWGARSGGRALAMRFLIFRISAFGGVELITLLVLGDLPTDVLTAVLGGIVGSASKEAFYCTVWWFYFKKSKRVRNTYGADA